MNNFQFFQKHSNYFQIHINNGVNLKALNFNKVYTITYRRSDLLISKIAL